MITKEQIEQQRSHIDEIYATGDMAALYRAAQKLYRDTDSRYGYFLGACYLNGWGVEPDPDYASLLLISAARNGDNYDYACYMAAIAYYRQRKYFDAYNWFCKAEEAGIRDSLTLFADSAAGCTMDLWNEVRQ